MEYVSKQVFVSMPPNRCVCVSAYRYSSSHDSTRVTSRVDIAVSVEGKSQWLDSCWNKHLISCR